MTHQLGRKAKGVEPAAKQIRYPRPNVGTEIPPSRHVGRYEILGEIGRGAMATVYLARQSDLNRLVALKELSGFHVGSSEFVERFLREAQLAGSLSHPNVVTVLHHFKDSGVPYIAMEYIPRGSLRPWVGKLSLVQLAGVLEGILAGLAAAEHAKIVHRDLKPENVMVTAEGRVKIADFGIAKATQSTNARFMTATGTAIGTPMYMAPEQALGEEIGTWTDLYSVGVLTHELLVGRAPFHDSDTAITILYRHLNEAIPSVIELRPGVDAALSAWVDRLLVKEPTQRTRSALQAWVELEEVILKLLGPSWQREARLPESGPPMHGIMPLARAPLGSWGTGKPAATPAAPPEAESRFLSFERTPGSLLAARDRPAQAPPERRSEHVSRSTERPDPMRADPPDTDSPRKSSTSSARVPRRIGWLGAAALTALAGVAGFLAFPSPGGNAGALAPLKRRASTSAIAVSYPSNWHRPSTAPSISGLPLRNSLALAAPSGGGLLIGGSDSGDVTMLPEGLLRTLPHVPHGEAVHLGDQAFYRYRNLLPQGAKQRETIYVQPTTAGTVTGVCTLPATATATVGVSCERILGSLELLASRALPLGPSPRYAEALKRAVFTLNATASHAGAQLAKARTAGAQANAAYRMERAYKKAASAMRDANPGPAEQAANSALAQSLSGIANGYTALVHAARTEDTRGFARGRAEITAATLALAGSLRALRKLGYQVGG
jgi:serine/threonine protein kinase